MTSPEMHTLAGAFAVDAVSDLERARFQRHLEECESCSLEVRELRATAARLGAAVAEDPPPELKARVLAEIRVTRQQPPIAEPEPPRSIERSTGGSRVPRWALGLVAVAAVVGLALAGVFGGIALHTQSRLDDAQALAAQARSTYAPVAELLGAPDAQVAHGPATVGGGGTVVVSRSLNKLMFMPNQLPARTSNSTYEAWLIRANGPPRPIGLLPGGAQDNSIVMAAGIDGANRVALSVEQAGGSKTGLPSDDKVLNIAMPA
jgi:anti-sigma-K factor RskA